MKVSIEYREKDRQYGYPKISHEVYVNDTWNDNEIKEWYEQRHSHVNHVGINVEKIIHI